MISFSPTSPSSPASGSSSLSSSAKSSFFSSAPFCSSVSLSEDSSLPSVFSSSSSSTEHNSSFAASFNSKSFVESATEEETSSSSMVLTRLSFLCRNMLDSSTCNRKFYSFKVMERGGVEVCSVPCNRKVVGSNLPQATA